MCMFVCLNAHQVYTAISSFNSPLGSYLFFPSPYLYASSFIMKTLAPNTNILTHLLNLKTRIKDLQESLDSHYHENTPDKKEVYWFSFTSWACITVTSIGMSCVQTHLILHLLTARICFYLNLLTWSRWSCTQAFCVPMYAFHWSMRVEW